MDEQTIRVCPLYWAGIERELPDGRRAFLCGSCRTHEECAARRVCARAEREGIEERDGPPPAA